MDPRIELTALLAEVGAGSDLRSRAVDRQSVAEAFSDWMRTKPPDMGNTVRRGISRYDGKRVENPSGYIVETLRAVFQSLFATDGFEGALVDVVNRGGDSDTTGAILGMIAGALYGSGGIPRRWLTALDREITVACAEQAVSLVCISPLGGGAGKPVPPP